MTAPTYSTACSRCGGGTNNPLGACVCAVAQTSGLVAERPAKAPGMAGQALAGEIVYALLADEKHGGYDLTAGMFGPEFSRLVRRWAAAEFAAPAPAQPDQSSIHLQDLRNALAEADVLRQQLGLLKEQQAGSVWLWEAEGRNSLETMGNRMGVLIYASDLRALLSAQAAQAEQDVIAAFLERTGQYVTNDASREAAIADAVDQALAAQAAQPAAQAAPVLFVSPGQLTAHTDLDAPEAGRYLPARKTSAGKFTMALYATAHPSQDAENARRWRWALAESPEWTYAVCKWDGCDWLPIRTEVDISELDAAQAQGGA